MSHNPASDRPPPLANVSWTEGPRRNIDPDEALRLVLEATPLPLPERLPLAQSLGRTLAQNVCADRPYPAFPRATMDGYAVRLADAGRIVQVVGQLAAGAEPAVSIAPGQCVEIMTGAPCPHGAEAVVPKELATRNAQRVQLPSAIQAGDSIAPVGSECAIGQTVLCRGQTITPLAVAVMASFGHATVEVLRRPSLAVITTGAELVDVNAVPRPGQIRDSNGQMLVAMARAMGIEDPLLLHADDRLDDIRAALQHCADRQFVLLSGGVSAGAFDLVPQAIEAHGAQTIFHQVTQKPGKPLLVARRGEQMLFGLPGNPLASHLCFHRYVAAAIRVLEERNPVPVPLRAQLAVPVHWNGPRTRFLLARAERTVETEFEWTVHPLPGVSSADLFSLASANCYLHIPPGPIVWPAGKLVVFSWVAGWEDGGPTPIALR